MKIQIVIFTVAEWDSYHRKEMIKTLARVGGDQVEILCINRPIDFFVTPIKHFNKFIKWIRGENRYKKISDNLYVYTPLVILHDIISSRIIILKQLLIWMLRFQIKKRLSFNEKGRVVTWICSPNHRPFIELFPESFLLYEIYDEYVLDYDGEEKDFFKKIENIILNRADKVFVTSENLFKTKKDMNTEVYYIPNGINKEFLKFASLPIPLDIADLYKNIPVPRIGYLGHVRNWIDYPLLQFAAENNPDYSFVFVGNVEKDSGVKKLASLNNVFFLGKVDYNKVMHHIKQMDVCIIPFRINKFMINTCPNKLFEYMAAEKPIVSTDLPEVKKFYPYARVAKDKEEFALLLQEAVNNDKEFKIPKELIEDNLWEKRVQQILNLIYTLPQQN